MSAPTLSAIQNASAYIITIDMTGTDRIMSESNECLSIIRTIWELVKDLFCCLACCFCCGLFIDVVARDGIEMVTSELPAGADPDLLGLVQTGELNVMDQYTLAQRVEVLLKEQQFPEEELAVGTLVHSALNVAKGMCSSSIINVSWDADTRTLKFPLYNRSVVIMTPPDSAKEFGA